MQRIIPPLGGIGKKLAHEDTKAQPFSRDMDNVRPVDTQEKLLRIGQRPGVDKWGSGDQIGTGPIVFITSVNSVE